MNLRTNKNYFLTAIWLLLCVASFGAFNWYKLKPGPVGKISSYWPLNVNYQYERSAYSLVMFAHPKCGCTHASVIELEKLISKTHGKIKSKIFFYHPKGTDPSWTYGASRTLAMKISDTEVFEDEGGEVARRFGALTSGQVMVYSPEGKLSYAGGITESRGHIGESEGHRGIASVVRTGIVKISAQQTYGCLLFSEKEMNEYKD